MTYCLKKLTVLLTLCWFAIPFHVRGETMQIFLANDIIRITSDFSGSEIVVFGLIKRNVSSVSRSEQSEIIVTLEGPPHTAAIRRKERVAGLWINRAQRTYVNVPNFLAIASTRPIDDISYEVVRQKHQIGLDEMVMPTVPGSTPSEDSITFRDAYLRLKATQGSYRHNLDTIEIVAEDVFVARFEIPANIPLGEYKIRAFLLNGGVLLAAEEKQFRVEKFGIEELISWFALQHGLLYGLVTLILAVFTGWFGGVVFRRD